ncbi:hypothetical protein PHMEG_00035656 [Phytophthora megakarya]|uniref:Uncharacterized protein n=1 Tax=Phytophthora megakarya TaxID=4795 RepID=A0A225UN96_9STRA|nr:hypothetical protein PHMEG_00035656 [Phytophthora megakarya]
MSPRTTKPTAVPSSQEEAPLAVVCKPTATDATRDILYVYEGELHVIAVSPKTRGISLRSMIVQQLGLKLRPAAIRLIVLRKEDGTWANQDDADTTFGVELRYPLPISKLLPQLGEDSDMIHLRVESVARRRSTPKDGNLNTAEEAVNRYNEAMSKKRKATEQTVPFSKCDKTTTDDLHKYITTDKYTQQAEKLPVQYVSDIKRDYAKNIKARGVPWDLSEHDRHVFIESVLVTCINAAQDQIDGEFTDPEERKQNSLTIRSEYEIKDAALAGVGKADWVIKKGNRMVVVIEAMRCDVTYAKYQNIAAMETARCVNKMIRNSWQSIKGICTDFQSWVFVSRDNKSVCMDDTSVVISNTPELPYNLLNIANKVYGMLVHL